MFTVKFFSQTLSRDDAQVLILEGDEVEILPASSSYDYFVRVKGRAGSSGRAVRWLTDLERLNSSPVQDGAEPYFEAIIENANGKTTHIVRAKQPVPPVSERQMAIQVER